MDMGSSVSIDTSLPMPALPVTVKQSTFDNTNDLVGVAINTNDVIDGNDTSLPTTFNLPFWIFYTICQGMSCSKFLNFTL